MLHVSRTVTTFYRVILLFSFFCALSPRALAEETLDSRYSILQAVQEAGNMERDKDRLLCLKELSSHPGLSLAQKEDLNKLISEIEQWVFGKRLEYFGGKILQDKDWMFGIPEQSPLYPLTYLYRARMITWVTLEYGGVIRNDERRREFLDRARHFFQLANQHFPENQIVRMYLGEPIPPAKHYPPAPGAPEWAVYQRECLERLADIVEWWIDNRMQKNGEYGGGWGDDCEMWRWWVPVLTAFDDPKIAAAQEKFSEAILSQPHMKDGYTSHLTDVEHTAEDSSDAMTPMMHLDPDNPIWKKRVYRLAELMKNLWTGKNERGFLQFKSTFFSANRVSDDPKRACDTTYHVRAMQPALLYWQRTGDPELGNLFTQWMDTWVDATTRTDRGKPKGVIPTAIHWPDGKVGGLEGEWWNPENYGEKTLYQWPSAMTMMTNALLLTYHMTGDDKYLEPLRSMADIRLQYLDEPYGEPTEAGSKAWCASRIRISSVLAKYKLLTGSGEFDKLLKRENDPYTLYRFQNNKESLVSALRDCADALRVNFPGYTSEVRYTDRVLRFPVLFEANYMFEEPVATIRRPDPGLLYSTATGDPGTPMYFPISAVRWLTPPRDIAVLVNHSGSNRFDAELFHFGYRARNMSVELYLLSEGTYKYSISPARVQNAGQIEQKEFVVSGPRTQISIEIPSRELTALKIRKLDSS